MAGRQVQRRILSLLADWQSQNSLSLRNVRSLPSASSIFRRDEFNRRRFQTLTDSNKEPLKDLERHEASKVMTESDSANVISGPISNKNSEVTYKATSTSNQKISPRHDMAMMYTCARCDTRSAKTLSRESYENGVVVVRCGGCDNLHLIADNIGMFGEAENIEKILAARGQEVKRGSVDSLNLTAKDLAGIKALNLEMAGQ